MKHTVVAGARIPFQQVQEYRSSGCKYTVPAGANIPFQRVQIYRSSRCKYTVPAGANIPFQLVHIPFQQVQNTVPAGAKYRSSRCIFSSKNFHNLMFL